jgi:hypothetical protein
MIRESKRSDPGDAEMLDQPIVALTVKERGHGQVVLVGSGIPGTSPLKE